MKYSFILLFFFLFQNVYAYEEKIQDIPKLAQELHLYGGQKAIVQWERLFSSPRRLKKYKLDTLPVSIRIELKNYLILHAADSEQPIIPGL